VALIRVFVFSGVLSCLLAGCACVQHVQSPELPPPPAQAASIAVPEPSATPVPPTPARPPVVTVAPPAAAPPAPVPTPKTAPAPVAARPAAPTLDLESLETRLRGTQANGMFTKLSLKNQVDDLLVQFRAYHKHQAATTLVVLRQSYNLLMLKVLSLLQDSDPPLARDIVASREAIWGILSDPKKFTESNLMAGVTP
jgi:hypothetical protein